ncbi:MAG: DUF177 domain-containing protein, partial [Lactobacillaceae bacterium]|nr:DUF177 domain-containing protein [Lactobacillaceae bacterium]
MKFSVPQLQKYKKEPLLIDETIDIKEMAISRFPERLVDLSPLHVVGQIAYKPNDRIKLDLNVTGTAVVETSINLERVEVPLDIVIDELYVQDEVSLNMFPLTDQVFLVENNQLIIDEIVLEDVIVELPIALEDAQDVDTSG